MKKTGILFLLTSFSLLVISCTWTPPKSIAIKTDAEYNFGIGEIEKDFSSYFESDKILSLSTSADNSRVYDYYPEKKDAKIQKYLMKLPIQEIAVDFTEYFNSTKLAESIKDLSFSKEVTIPELNLSMTKAVPLDKAYAAINAIVTGTGATPSNALTYTGHFTSVKYDNAIMKITCSSPAATGVVTLKHNGTKIASDVITRGTADLDISGKTIYKTGMTLDLPTGAGSFTAVITSDSTITEAKGITLPSSVLIPFSSKIDNNNATDDFAECTVGTGSLDLTVNIPNSWTNTSVEYDVDLTGAINTNAVASVGKTKQVPLDGKTIKNGETTVASNIVLTFTDAEINFADVPTVSAATNISEYASIGIVLKEVNTSINETEPISDEMKDMVERLVLEQSGLKGKYINTFPAGNDISIIADSSFMGLNGSKATLASATTDDETNQPEFTLKSDAKKTVKFRKNPAAADEYSQMDFSVGIVLPGATADNLNKIKVVNVAPKSTYKIILKLEPDVNWESITLRSQGAAQTGFKSTGLNVNGLFKAFSDAMKTDFSDKVSLRNLPISIYAVKPELDCFKQAEFTGSMDMLYCRGPEEAPEPVLEYGTLNFMEDGKMPFQNMPQLEQEEKTIITNIKNFTPSKSDDLGPMCNKSKGETTGAIYIDYNLKFVNTGVSGETFTVTYADYKTSGAKNSTIAIYAFIELNLDFDLSDEVSINLLKMADKDDGKDLLGREEAPSQEKKNQFLSAVKSIDINYKSTQVPFYGIPEAKMRLDLDGPENSYFEIQDFDLKAGTFEVDSFESIFNIYPLVPETYVVLQKGKFTVPREIKMVANISMKIEMDSKDGIVIWESK